MPIDKSSLTNKEVYKNALLITQRPLILEYSVLLHQNKERDGSHLTLGGMCVYMFKRGHYFGMGCSPSFILFPIHTVVFFLLILEYGVGFLT